jgi:hypothetical protein
MNAIISAPHGADPLLRGTLMRTSSITPSESLPIGPLLPKYQLATRAAIDARLRAAFRRVVPGFQNWSFLASPRRHGAFLVSLQKAFYFRNERSVVSGIRTGPKWKSHVSLDS